MNKEREKKIINIKSKSYLKDDKSIYISQDTHYDPLFVMAIAISKQEIVYNRRVIGIADICSDIGGLLKTVHVMAGLMAVVICKGEQDLKLV